MIGELTQLPRDSNYKLTQFKKQQMDTLKKRITVNKAGKKPAPYVECLVRGRSIKLTPEKVRGGLKPLNNFSRKAVETLAGLSGVGGSVGMVTGFA
jgi:hypothetical protein